MSVVTRCGRRIPRRWMSRHINKVKGLITFQEHIWTMIKQSFSLAKRKANASGNIEFVMSKDHEIEDINYELEWIIIIIRGTPEQEEEEYNEAMGMYGAVASTFKKEFPKEKNPNLAKYFKTKILSSSKVEDAYKKGYGCMGDNNIANKLLEMGILTHIEWIKDFKEREVEIKPDF